MRAHQHGNVNLQTFTQTGYSEQKELISADEIMEVCDEKVPCVQFTLQELDLLQYWENQSNTQYSQ